MEAIMVNDGDYVLFQHHDQFVGVPFADLVSRLSELCAGRMIFMFTQVPLPARLHSVHMNGICHIRDHYLDVIQLIESPPMRASTSTAAAPAHDSIAVRLHHMAVQRMTAEHLQGPIVVTPDKCLSMAKAVPHMGWTTRVDACGAEVALLVVAQVLDGTRGLYHGPGMDLQALDRAWRTDTHPTHANFYSLATARRALLGTCAHTQDKQPTCLLLIGPLPEGCAEPVPQHVGENGHHHAEEEEAMDAHDDDEQEDTDSDVAITHVLGPQ